MKKNIFLSLTTAFVLAGTSLYATSENKADLQATVKTDTPIHSFWAFGPSPDHVTKKQLAYFKSMGLIDKHQMISKEIAKVTAKHEKAPTEVLHGLSATVKAMAALEKKDKKSAEKYLTEATKQFDAALKKNTALKLVPVDEDVNVIANVITPDQAKEIKKDAMKTLKNNQPQETIALLSALVDQITITTTYLPMDLYPKATHTALEELKKGKDTKVALATLIDGLSTIVNTQVVIPLPLLMAQKVVSDAEKLGNKEKKKTVKLLDLAQGQLVLAQYEGYISADSTEYKTLSSEIKKLKEKAEKGNIVSKDYDKAKSYFHTLSEKFHKGTKKQ